MVLSVLMVQTEPSITETRPNLRSRLLRVRSRAPKGIKDCQTKYSHLGDPSGPEGTRLAAELDNEHNEHDDGLSVVHTEQRQFPDSSA